MEDDWLGFLGYGTALSSIPNSQPVERRAVSNVCPDEQLIAGFDRWPIPYAPKSTNTRACPLRFPVCHFCTSVFQKGQMWVEKNHAKAYSSAFAQAVKTL
ncbi:MAG: hypothetical protein HYT46_00745 [Candidatus Vogelbacteria bacterium]|nr:hypothetical protein [Candidatus Vogelbacteria bacterium]